MKLQKHKISVNVSSTSEDLTVYKIKFCDSRLTVRIRILNVLHRCRFILALSVSDNDAYLQEERCSLPWDGVLGIRRISACTSVLVAWARDLSNGTSQFHTDVKRVLILLTVICISFHLILTKILRRNKDHRHVYPYSIHGVISTKPW